MCSSFLILFFVIIKPPDLPDHKIPFPPKMNSNNGSKPNKQRNMVPARRFGVNMVFSVVTRCRPAAAVKVHL